MSSSLAMAQLSALSSVRAKPLVKPRRTAPRGAAARAAAAAAAAASAAAAAAASTGGDAPHAVYLVNKARFLEARPSKRAKALLDKLRR